MGVCQLAAQKVRGANEECDHRNSRIARLAKCESPFSIRKLDPTRDGRFVHMPD